VTATSSAPDAPADEPKVAKPDDKSWVQQHTAESSANDPPQGEAPAAATSQVTDDGRGDGRSAEVHEWTRQSLKKEHEELNMSLEAQLKRLEEAFEAKKLHPKAKFMAKLSKAMKEPKVTALPGSPPPPPRLCCGVSTRCRRALA